MKKNTIAFLLMSVLVFSSCSDDSTSTSTPDNLINFSKGNYWVFDTYPVDRDFNRTGQKYRDSIVAEVNETYEGKDTWFFIRYRDKANYDTLILSIGETKIYRYLRPHEIDLPGFSAKWITFSELSDSWHISNSAISIDVDHDGFTESAVAQYAVNGYLDGRDTVVLFEGKRSIGPKFRIKNDMLANFTHIYEEQDTCHFQLQRAKQTTYSISKDVGFIRILKHPYLYKIASFSNDHPGKMEWIDGEESEIMGYHVNF